MTFREHFQAWAMNRKLLCEQELRMYETLIRALKNADADPEHDPDVVIPPQELPEIKQADAKWLTAPPSAAPPPPVLATPPATSRIMCKCVPPRPAFWYAKGNMYLCGASYKEKQAGKSCDFKMRA